jgi:hypothetical protein
MPEYKGNTCPCGSNKEIKFCCLQLDNTLNKKYYGVLPKGPITGHAHPDCFLSATSDCCRKISAEHYISQSILRSIRKGEEKLIRFSGAAWLKGEERLLSPTALTSKILCRRHNSLLHPLDDAALALTRAFVRTFDADKFGGENSLILTSGHAFEAWAIKLAVGCVHSGTFADDHGKSLKDNAFLPPALLPALRAEPLQHGCGLYMQVGVGFETPGHPPFQVAPFLMSHLGQTRIVGATFAIFGVIFRILFDPEGIPENQSEEGWAYRPGIIQFTRSDFASALALSWSDERTHGKVDFSLSRRSIT